MRLALEKNQPPEQTGFRKSYSTSDNIQALKDLIEKSNEYKLPLYLGFIDYNKAFDSIERTALWKSLGEQGVPLKIINILRLI